MGQHAGVKDVRTPSAPTFGRSWFVKSSFRMGGGDPDTNSRLRLARWQCAQGHDRQRYSEVTGQLPGVSYEEVRYEGYGVGGAALIIDCTTDNRVRTVTRSSRFDEAHRTRRFCVLHVPVGEFLFAPGVTTEDAVMEIALEAGADDVVSDEDGSIEVTCDPEAFDAVQKAFEAAGITPEIAEITYKALNETKLTGADPEKCPEKIMILEDLDDVPHTSASFDDEE